MSERNPQILDLEIELNSTSVMYYKKPDCKFYETCLDEAAEASWPQFHCRECQVFEIRKIDHTDMYLTQALLPTIYDGDSE